MHLRTPRRGTLKGGPSNASNWSICFKKVDNRPTRCGGCECNCTCPQRDKARSAPAVEPCKVRRCICELGTARPRGYAAGLGEMAEPGAIVGGGRRLLWSNDMAGFFHGKLGAGLLEKAQPGTQRGLVRSADVEGDSAQGRCRWPA